MERSRKKLLKRLKNTQLPNIVCICCHSSYEGKGARKVDQTDYQPEALGEKKILFESEPWIAQIAGSVENLTQEEKKEPLAKNVVKSTLTPEPVTAVGEFTPTENCLANAETDVNLAANDRARRSQLTPHHRRKKE